MHKQLKSPIASMYSLSNAVTYEAFIDQTLQVLFRQLDDRYVTSQEAFDLGDWLQFFAFDVMGTLTFSKRYGFLEKGGDNQGMLDTVWEFMSEAAPFTQIPWLDVIWRKNRLAAKLTQAQGVSILKVVAEHTQARIARAGKMNGDDPNDKLNDRDMLSRFLEVARTNDAVPSW